MVLLILGHPPEGPAQTTQPDVPDPSTLIDRCRQAAGGKEKLESVRSIHMTGTIEMPAQNIQGTLQAWLKPDRALIVAELPGIGQIRSGIYDQVGYELSDITGARLLDETEKKQLLDGLNPDNQFQRFLELKDPHVTGPETLGKRKAWKLQGKTSDGDTESHWIDTETFYLLKSRMTLHHQMGKIPVEMTLSEYRSVDGIPLPSVIVQRTGPAVQKIHLTDIRLNPSINDNVFALPDQIRQLVERSSKTSQE
jgi:outer membrane lipoprotein-sorting protein